MFDVLPKKKSFYRKTNHDEPYSFPRTTLINLCLLSILRLTEFELFRFMYFYFVICINIRCLAI